MKYGENCVDFLENNLLWLQNFLHLTESCTKEALKVSNGTPLNVMIMFFVRLECPEICFGGGFLLWGQKNVSWGKVRGISWGALLHHSAVHQEALQYHDRTSRRIAIQKQPKLWPPCQICSLPVPEHKIAVYFSSFRHTFLVDHIHFISKSDCHGVHSWLLLEETFGPQWWWSPLYTVICFRIILKHTRLASMML